MLKTYLYIPDHLGEQIKQTAKAQKKSKAEVMRIALQEGLKITQNQQKASIEVLFKIAELARKNNVTGPKDAVEHFDDYLYSKDWSKSE